jgi:hypothetical protein
MKVVIRAALFAPTIEDWLFVAHLAGTIESSLAAEWGANVWKWH